jgi:hypothetical protein
MLKFNAFALGGIAQRFRLWLSPSGFSFWNLYFEIYPPEAGKFVIWCLEFVILDKKLQGRA